MVAMKGGVSKPRFKRELDVVSAKRRGRWAGEDWNWGTVSIGVRRIKAHNGTNKGR